MRSALLAVPRAVRRWACAAHLALIAVLSLLPGWIFPASASRIPGLDKWVHAAMYGVLGALLRWAAGAKVGPAGRWLPLAGGGYGLLMEFLQRWISGGSRTFSWGDAAANLAGVVLLWMAAGRILDGDEIFPAG